MCAPGAEGSDVAAAGGAEDGWLPPQAASSIAIAIERAADRAYLDMG
jgi:hypothetical protein